MASNLSQGDTGTPLPRDIIVVRLGIPTKDGGADASHFVLSTDDMASKLQSLSVWAKDLTPPEKGRELMGETRVKYLVALHLLVSDIRSIEEQSNAPLDVVWDRDLRPGAEGHAGIIRLKMLPGLLERSRNEYRALRARLAEIATVEILPEIAA